MCGGTVNEHRLCQKCGGLARKISPPAGMDDGELRNFGEADAPMCVACDDFVTETAGIRESSPKAPDQPSNHASQSPLPPLPFFQNKNRKTAPGQQRGYRGFADA